MCGLQLWIIMTNVNDLSDPANTMYRTALFPLTSSVQQPPTNTWCKQASVTAVLRAPSSRHRLSPGAHMLHSLCPPCVCVCGEQEREHEWVTHLLVLICSYMLVCFTCWQCETAGSDSHRVSKWTGKMNAHNTRLLYQEYCLKNNVCDTWCCYGFLPCYIVVIPQILFLCLCVCIMLSGVVNHLQYISLHQFAVTASCATLW